MSSFAPIVGAWYQDNIDQQLFEVVALDEYTATIDVQYIDGEISEFDYDTWEQLNLTQACPPEDATAPFEQSADDNEHWGLDDVFHPSGWEDPISSIEGESFMGFDDI